MPSHPATDTSVFGPLRLNSKAASDADECHYGSQGGVGIEASQKRDVKDWEGKNKH